MAEDIPISSEVEVTEVSESVPEEGIPVEPSLASKVTGIADDQLAKGGVNADRGGIKK